MRQVSVRELDFEKGGGLIPVVAQDATTRDVLMVAYANRQAVEMTLDSGYAHYWSRSRQELWKKGATSGHVQKIRDVLVDCDNDTLLYLIDQTGPACHTGERSCFHRQLATGTENQHRI